MKRYTIVITGEGPTDIGQKEYGEQGWKWGPLKSFIDKCAEEIGIRIILIPVERQEIEKLKLQRSQKLENYMMKF